MKTLFSVACVAALCLGVSFTPAIGQDAEADGPSYSLAIKFTKGETRRYETKMEMTQEMDFGMGPMKTSMTNATVTADTCREVRDDGSVVVASKTESMAMKMDNPMMKFAYDSAKPDAEAFKQFPMLRASFVMVGETITATLSADRKVTKLEGLKEIRERAEKDFTAEELEMLGDALDENNMKQTLEATYAAWPKEPVAVGGTWDNSMKIPANEAGTMKMDMNYKLAGVEKRDGMQVALIDVSGTIEFSANEDGMNMKVTTQKVEGKLVFDMDKGETLELTTTMTFEMSMEGMPGVVKSNVVSTQKRLAAKKEVEEITDETDDE